LVARAFSQSPPLLLADDPTATSPGTSIGIMQLLYRLKTAPSRR